MLYRLAYLAVLLALAQAAPASTPDEVIRQELRAAIYEKARQTGQTPREVARQLPFGGDAYKPYQVPCPNASPSDWVRSANGLGGGETNYLSQRKPYLESAVKTQVSSHGIAQPPRTPVIGYALSGGGYRAMQVGLGGVMGTMNASAEAASSGTGGWFDAVTYMAGLSGGSWATGTFMANDGQLPSGLVDDVWNLESNLVVPDDGKVQFYYNLISNVRAKANAGFPTQITDYWGLALGDHLLPSQYHLDNSPNYTYSSLPSTVNGLKNGSLPMPIIIAAEREAGELVVAENATVWEFTPWEFGAWAFGNNTKVRGAFTPMEYLGTPLNNAQPANSSSTCWKGFDQLSFVMGTSSTLFNAALVQLTAANASGIIVDAISSVLESIGEQENDIARYPNSFAGWNPDTNPITDLEYLTLVDAGETNQNLPIEPLLIPYRGVDAILAFDSSADTEYSWPNGSALRTTYERAVQLAKQQDVSIRMPRVPTTNGFVNGGYNTRPTFFGCEANGTTPIIVYVPNYPWSYYGNTSTFMLAYDEDESDGVILNGMRSLTLNGTVPSWPQCLTCALTDRAFNYTTANRTAECQACFNTWCWDGTDDDTTPSTAYEPVLGSVPAFLTQNNLVSASSGDAAASSAAPAASSSAASTSSTAATSGAHRRLEAAGAGALLLPHAAVALLVTWFWAG